MTILLIYLNLYEVWFRPLPHHIKVSHKCFKLIARVSSFAIKRAKRYRFPTNGFYISKVV